MTIGPDSKKINEALVKLNRSQNTKNSESVSKSFNENVSIFLEKKQVLNPATDRASKPFTNLSSPRTGATYNELLTRVKASQTKIVAINDKAFDKYSEEDIDKFLVQSLPDLTSASLVFDYHDKFTPEGYFERWASNFRFTDDPEHAYEYYNPMVMSTKNAENRSEYSEYFNEEGLIIAEAFNSKLDEKLAEYSANADNVLILTEADLAENPKIINKFVEASGDKRQAALLAKSKYVFWGNPPEVIRASAENASRVKWSKYKFDKLNLYLDDEGKKDALRIGFREDPKQGYGVFVPDSGKIEYVVPDCIRFLEAYDNSYRLAKAHIGALSEVAVTAANRTVSNLTIENTTYGSYKIGKTGNWEVNPYKYGKTSIKHAFDYDWGDGNAVGEGYIGDVIYQMYLSASSNNIFSTGFGRYINKTHRDGVSTKSEMDLQTTAGINLANVTIDRKLHVATAIGFTMYNKKGREITGYISSSDETIPPGTRHGLFAIGRLAALKNRIASGSTDLHRYYNNPIKEMIASGPDFMANMYDVYIIKYTIDDNSKAISQPVDMISLTTNPKIVKSFNDTRGSTIPSSEDLKNGLPTTSQGLLQSKYDFISRVSSVTIPSMESDTIEYSFLGQKYAVPGYKLQHEFSTSLTIEMDADLEYMRTINKIAGFINKYRSSDTTNNTLDKQVYRPNRIRIGNQKIGILIKLTPGNMFYNPNDNFRRYLIFEDVLFTGGGNVSFSQSNSDMVTADFKFIYKNIAMGDFPVTTNTVLRDAGETIEHIGEAFYAPAIQQLNNINLGDDVLKSVTSGFEDMAVPDYDIHRNYSRGGI